jgi:hypothetical protein
LRGTRQRALCRVPEIKHSAKNMALGKEPNSGSEHPCPWASEASEAEVVAAAAAEWWPKSDRWLELPESAPWTSARWTLGARLGWMG